MLTASQLLVLGFMGEAAVVAGPRSAQLLANGTGGVTDSTEFGNLRTLRGRSGEGVAFRSGFLNLRNADPSHDPRPAQLLEA